MRVEWNSSIVFATGVHNVLQGNVPVGNARKKRDLEDIKTLFEKVGKQEDFLQRKKETHTARWIPKDLSSQYL